MTKKILPHPMTLALLACVVLQVGLSNHLRDQRPRWDILPAAPSDDARAAMAFGDEQFLFRALAMELQMAGDTGGRITPLSRYDYAEVKRWLEGLSALDARSEWPPLMAARYFGLSQKPKEHLPHIVAYLRDHAASDPAAKWPWLEAAIFLADKRIENPELAFDIARQLAALRAPTLRPSHVLPYVRRLIEQKRYSEALAVLEPVPARFADSTDAQMLETDMPVIAGLISALKEVESQAAEQPSEGPKAP